MYCLHETTLKHYFTALPGPSRYVDYELRLVNENVFSIFGNGTSRRVDPPPQPLGLAEICVRPPRVRQQVRISSPVNTESYKNDDRKFTCCNDLAQFAMFGWPSSPAFAVLLSNRSGAPKDLSLYRSRVISEYRKC